MMPRAPSVVATGAVQRLGEGEHFGPGARGGSAVAGDDHDPAGAEQDRGGALDVALVGDRPVHRDMPRARFRCIGGSAVWPSSMTSPCKPVEVEMGRPHRDRPAPRARHGAAGAAVREVESTGVENLVTAENSGACGDFLVRVAVLERRLLVAGEGDHRAAAEIGVLQAGGEVGGADRLRHADARPPRDAGIAVGHVGRRLLGMRQDRRDPEIARAASNVRRMHDSTKKTCVMPVPASARASHSAPFIEAVSAMVPPEGYLKRGAAARSRPRDADGLPRSVAATASARHRRSASAR